LAEAHGLSNAAGSSAFTRIDADEVPDAKTILKIAQVLGPEAIQELHQRVVAVTTRAGVTHGRRFRVDNTVVETNVHYPTDSSLLQDGVRVLTRTLQPGPAPRWGIGAGAFGIADGVSVVAC
jgi:hypothetical protein